jgi:tetratricopeptide (TPR) repeat protein
MWRKVIFLSFFLILLSANILFSQTDEALKILENNRPSIISLTAYGEHKQIGGEGTGFVFEDGVIATSYLLVSQAISVEGKNFQGKKVKIESILAVDKSSLIALLKTKGKEPALTFGNSDDLKRDDKVFIIGTNEAGEIEVSDGTITNIQELVPGRKIIDTSISLSEKYNGGPVLNKNGQVLGITIVLERGLKAIIPSNLVKTLPKKTEIKFKNWQHEDYLSTPEGAFLAGKIAYFVDETGKAEKYLGKVIKDNPGNIDAQFLLASVFTRQRNYEAAISAYKKVIELDANRDDAYYGLGLVYINMRRFPEAIPTLEKAVQLNLDHKDAYLYLGNAYEELKDFAKAAEFYQKYVSLKPERPGQAFARLGLCKFEIGDFGAAVTAFQEALKENPQDTLINNRLAQALQKSGQYEKAEEVYKLLAQLSPEYAANYYRTILKMYDDARMNEKAIEIAKQIVEMNPGDPDSLFNLGLMYTKQKKYNEAIETYKKIIEIRPNSEFAYANLGQIYIELDQWNKVIDIFAKYVDLVPDNADAWHTIGVSYMKLKKFGLALDPLLKAIELRPDFGVAYFNLAITYLNLKDNASAREVYRKLLKIDPSRAADLKKYIR